MPSNCFQTSPGHLLSRRELLCRTGMGLGGLALADLLQWRATRYRRNRWSIAETHHPPKAKRVIYLFQSGGPSQLETFDYKPLLNEQHGRQLPDSVRNGQRLTGMSGNQASLPLAGSIFKFGQYGRIWCLDQRTAAVHGESRGRTGHHSIRRDRSDQSRSGYHVPANWQPDLGTAVDRGLAELWSGDGQRKPSGVRRADHQGESRSTAVFAAVGDGIPPIAIPGSSIPVRQGACPVSE